ncbi:hypothetical protein [Nevskia ramosa]|nr:hypothetical protein [Nevskia ramosa]
MNASRHLAVVLLLAPLALSASPPGPLVLERPFEFQLVLNGTQSWKSGVQATEATTKQTYTVSTRLRSNGFLYSDNLLDTDNAARMEIKPMYYARQGLERLRASNGGKLPTTPDDANTIFERYRQKGNHCRDNLECNQQAAEQIAAINAMQDNSREDLEAFLNSHGSGPEARFLYFFGYAGCPVKLSIQYALEITGTRAYDKKKEKPLPFKLIRTADSPGNEEDQKTLCEKYVATVDVKTGTIFVENLFVPAPPGTSKRTINTSTETVDEKIGLPPPFEALNWTSAKMRQTTESGEEKVSLPLTAALDGDNSVQGTFTGKLDISFRWSFKPPAGKAVPAKP